MLLGGHVLVMEQDVAHGMFIYEYGDHGGLLLMARHRNQETPTDMLYYSYDQGRCWHSVKLGESLYLENIRVEPQGASHVFVLHGVQVRMRAMCCPCCLVLVPVEFS